MGRGLGGLKSAKSFARQKHTLKKICTRTVETMRGPVRVMHRRMPLPRLLVTGGIEPHRFEMTEARTTYKPQSSSSWPLSLLSPLPLAVLMLSCRPALVATVATAVRQLPIVASKSRFSVDVMLEAVISVLTIPKTDSRASMTAALGKLSDRKRAFRSAQLSARSRVPRSRSRVD